MKIVPNIRLKKILQKRYWRSTRRLFVTIRQPIVNQAEYTDPQSLRTLLPVLLQPEQMQKHINDLWGKVGGKVFYDTERKLKPPAKAENSHMEIKADKEATPDCALIVKPFVPVISKALPSVPNAIAPATLATSAPCLSEFLIDHSPPVVERANP